jgi:hypothetical protein
MKSRGLKQMKSGGLNKGTSSGENPEAVPQHHIDLLGYTLQKILFLVSQGLAARPNSIRDVLEDISQA